eukprot:1258836-Prorocentrum_lima.AAC.1
MVEPDGLRGGGPKTAPAEAADGTGVKPHAMETDSEGTIRTSTRPRGMLPQNPSETEASTVFLNLLQTGTVTGRLSLDADM